MTEIFVFGSNTQGRHGKGAALYAIKHCGAVYGKAEGLQGNSYAIVTKNISGVGGPITLEDVAQGVFRFLQFAVNNDHRTFFVAKIGCGLSGFKESEIRPLFNNVPDNVKLPEGWR